MIIRKVRRLFLPLLGLRVAGKEVLADPEGRAGRISKGFTLNMVGHINSREDLVISSHIRISREDLDSSIVRKFIQDHVLTGSTARNQGMNADVLCLVRACL